MSDSRENFSDANESVHRSNKRTETKSNDGTNVNGEFAKKILPTLPPTFRSLLDTPISIEGDRPQEVIEYLGDLLGIADYATNMPSFWFLDTLALHVSRYKRDLDEYRMGVLISWLAGEIRLLRDRKHTRREFFREMKHIFIAAANKISEEERVPYWEEIVSLYERDAEGKMEEKLSTGNQSMGSLREPPSRGGFKLSGNIDPISVLDIVIEATYSMYANELRYALVYAVFVEPIEIQNYDLPFAIRTPRRVKLADSKMVPFTIELQRGLRKTEIAEKSKKPHKAGKTVKKKFDVPITPTPSLDDERMLMCSRLFILPLIEAKEATEMFVTHDA